MARETFGREISPAQAEAYRSRLLFMAQAVRILQDWEVRLRDSEPAAVHRTPTPVGDAYGSV
jgi:hypothetical protein